VKAKTKSPAKVEQRSSSRVAQKQEATKEVKPKNPEPEKVK
jgi:hypothetical protein